MKNRDDLKKKEKKNKSRSKKLLATDIDKFRIPIALGRVNKRSGGGEEGRQGNAICRIGLLV